MPDNLSLNLSPTTRTGPGNTPDVPPAADVPGEQPRVSTVTGLWKWLKTAIDNFLTIDGTLWSASFAYYAFFALFPLLLILVTLGTDVATRFVGKAHAQEAAFSWTVGKVEPYMPLSSTDRQAIRKTIQDAVNARGGIGIIAFAGLLWSSLGFFQALVGALNKAWGQKPLSWWALPLKNLTMLAILAAMLLIGVIAPVVLKTVEAYVIIDATVTPALFGFIGVLVPVAALFVGFLLFYKLAPRRRSKVEFGNVWIPALTVTALLQVLQQLFVFYTTRITNFNAVYGTFGGVIALMLWTYLSGIVIIFGGCLCAATRSIREPVVAGGSGAVVVPG